ncbi:MAG TPA: CYCXC family (seleno)protein [Gemmatimonadales bacterium]|nr:CYCXC family (seleno)protein [Gemmatimonadales bacterium]
MANSKLPWLVAGVAVVATAAILVATRGAGGGHHPTPRPGITGARVLPASTFGEDERLVRAYEAARAMPELFDGLYCYCHCKEDMGHVSLLTCYESEHAASCDICLGEAAIAVQMHAAGASLEEIRRAIDARYKT